VNEGAEKRVKIIVDSGIQNDILSTVSGKAASLAGRDINEFNSNQKSCHTAQRLCQGF
jgi:hypothetical protein